MIYKRGSSNNYWYRFEFNGREIKQSTKQSNLEVAQSMEAARRTAFALRTIYLTCWFPAIAPETVSLTTLVLTPGLAREFLDQGHKFAIIDDAQHLVTTGEDRAVALTVVNKLNRTQHKAGSLAVLNLEDYLQD